jgi:hypothetical protein
MVGGGWCEGACGGGDGAGMVAGENGMLVVVGDSASVLLEGQCWWNCACGVGGTVLVVLVVGQ